MLAILRDNANGNARKHTKGGQPLGHPNKVVIINNWIIVLLIMLLCIRCRLGFALIRLAIACLRGHRGRSHTVASTGSASLMVSGCCLPG